MCTNFMFTKRQGQSGFANLLGVDESQFVYSDHFKPGSTISIITDSTNGHQIKKATWWLYLTRHPAKGLIPNPDYFSVNTNWKTLEQRPEFKRSRCIVPASAFMESNKGKAPHILERADRNEIAFGGLFKTWTDRSTGEAVHSASIITLAGHPRLKSIHPKSTPLWLSDTEYGQWLDLTVTDTEVFREMLKPRLHAELRAIPIDAMGKRNPIGDSFLV